MNSLNRDKECKCECHTITPKYKMEWCLNCSKDHATDGEDSLLVFLLNKLAKGEFDERKNRALEKGKISGTQIKKILDAIKTYQDNTDK